MRTAVCGTINRAADGAEFGSRLADGQEAHARQNGFSRKKKGKPKHGWRQLEAAGEASGKGRNENQARRESRPAHAADESASAQKGRDGN